MRRLLAPFLFAALLIGGAAACTPSAEGIETSSVERVLADLDLPAGLDCEEIKPHKFEENTWVGYCSSGPLSGFQNLQWIAVDVAVKYKDTTATASATASYQQGNMVRYYRQVCEWRRVAGIEWERTRCPAPSLIAMYPLG